jgi:hypothetical protein
MESRKKIIKARAGTTPVLIIPDGMTGPFLKRIKQDHRSELDEAFSKAPGVVTDIHFKTKPSKKDINESRNYSVNW